MNSSYQVGEMNESNSVSFTSLLLDENSTSFSNCNGTKQPLDEVTIMTPTFLKLDIQDVLQSLQAMYPSN